MSSFHELINRNTPTLVDFFTHWCEPCKLVPPILSEVKNNWGERVNILKIDLDKNQKAAQKYSIKSIPTLILFKNGKVVWRKVGVAGADEIEKALRKVS